MPELFDFVSFVNPFKGHMKLPFNPKILCDRIDTIIDKF